VKAPEETAAFVESLPLIAQTDSAPSAGVTLPVMEVDAVVKAKRPATDAATIPKVSIFFFMIVKFIVNKKNTLLSQTQYRRRLRAVKTNYYAKLNDCGKTEGFDIFSKRALENDQAVK
jgi:hypothetical protein